MISSIFEDGPLKGASIPYHVWCLINGLEPSEPDNVLEHLLKEEEQCQSQLL